MNEELLKAIFENEGFAKKGVTYEQFKVDIKDPSLQEAIFNNAGFSKKGIDFNTFKNDLGVNIHQSNIPSSFQDPNRNSKDKGYRNNNPLNIKDFKTGKFKVFNNLEEGYIASEKDLSKKLSGKSPALIENLQKQGKSWGDATLADVILTWAPPSDNSKSALNNYIKSVGGDLGVDPYKVHPSQVNARDLTIAMSKVESPDSYSTLQNFIKSTEKSTQTRQKQLEKVKTDAKEEAEGLKGLVSWGQMALNKIGSFIPGTTGNLFSAKDKAISEIRDVDKNYKKNIEKQFINGNLKLENITDEELLLLYDNKTLVEDLKKRSEKSKKELDKQLKDEGLFEGLGDILAPQLLDKFVGGISGKSETRLNTKDGKVDISSKLNLSFSLPMSTLTELFLDPKDILELQYHPLAKSKDPNDPFNKSLRQVQKILTTPDSLEFQALATPTNLRLDISTKQIKDIEGKIIKSMGKPVLDKFYELNEKISQEQATPEEQEELQTILQEMQNKNIPLDQLSSTFKHRAENLQKLQDTTGKFGQLQKLENLKSIDSKNADDIDRSLTGVSRSLSSISNILDNTLNTVVGGIPDAIGAIGVMGEGVVGGEIGFTDAAKRKADNQVEVIKSSNKTKGATSYDMVNVDGYRAVWTQKGDPLIYDKDGYIIRDKSEIKRVTALANEKLKKDYNNDYKELGITYNGLSTWDGIEDTIPQLAGIFAFGGLAKAGGMALSGKILARGSRNGLVANTLNTMATSGKLTSSIGTIPTFAGDFMTEAIKDGATTPGQIGLTTAVKLAQEALAESIFEGPLGRALSAKGVTKAAFRETFLDQVTNSLRHYGTNRTLVTKDLLMHSKNVLTTFVKDTLGEGFEEFIVEATTPDLNGALNSLVGTKYNTDEASTADLLNATLVGMGAGALMGGGSVIRAMSNSRAEINDAYDQELSEVIAKSTSALMKNETVLSPEAFKEHTKPLVEKGLITEEYANKYYSAVKEAATRTKFLDEIDTSTSFFNDNDIDSKEKFMSFARGLAYDKAMLSKEESENAIQRAKDSVKVSQYDTILKQLETNSYAGLYTATTPFRIGSDKSINLSPESQAKLGSSQEAILEEVNKTKFNQDNKVKYYNLLLHKKAIELKKLDEKTSEKEKEKLDSKTGVINKEIEKVKKQETKSKAKKAVKANVATPEQLSLISAEEKGAVDSWFDLYDKELRDGTISKDALVQLYENNQTQGENINKRLKALDLEKYIQQAEDLSKQESKAKPTAKVGFFARYNGNPDLEKVEHQTFTNSFENHLKEKLNTLDPSSLFYNQEIDEINTLIEQVADPNSVFNNSTYEEKYNNYPFFRELVDEATKTTKKPAKYTEPKRKPAAKKEPVKKESTKKEDLKDNKQEDINQLEKELNDLGIVVGENNLKESAEKILEDIQSPFVKQVLKALLNLISKTGTTLVIVKEGGIGYNPSQNKITIGLDTILDGFNRNSENRSKGTTNGSFAIKYGKSEGTAISYFATTLLHEILHTFTSKQIDIFTGKTKGELTKQETGILSNLQKIFDLVKTNPILKGEYGLYDLHELIAEIFSNETFADKLKNISLPKELQYKTKSKNLFDGIIDLISDLITKALKGFSKQAINNEETAFQNISNLVNDLINAKYDAELAVLIDKSPEKEPEKPGRGTTKNQGRLSISVDGYNAINIANNKLINENLLKGDPIYYRIGQRNGKDIIESVLYFKNGKFVSKEDGGKEILAGQLNITDKTIELADRIKGSTDKIIKAVVSQSPYYNKGYNKKEGGDVKNKSKLTPEEVATLRPNMYVIGQDYQSNEPIILLNREIDGAPFLTIPEFIRKYILDNPQYKNQENNLKSILSNDTPNFLNGKTFAIHGGEIILFDVLPNKDVPGNAELIKSKIEELAVGEKYKNLDEDSSGYVQNSTADINYIVSKRDNSLSDSANSGTPNVHGKLLQFYAAGPVARQKQIDAGQEGKPVYKLARNEQEELSEKYLSEQEAIQELLNIRANIDHDVLRGNDSEYNEYLSDILEIPYGIKNGRTVFYNVINTIVEESESIITADMPVVPETEAKPENKEKLDIISEPLNSSTIIIDDSNIDFKASDKDYSGRIEEAVDYIKNRFEEIGVEIDDVILRNLVKGTSAEGSKVWGAFHNAMVTLSSISGEKVGKHEAMHVVFKMFLNKQQQIDILNELWSKHKDDPRYKGKEEQFKKEMQEFLTSDTFDTKQDFKLTDQEQVNFSLKAVNILQSDKAKQVFDKGGKNNWSLDKILSELQVPKEQKALILDLGITNREQIALELASNYNYTVEINTAKEKTVIDIVDVVEGDPFSGEKKIYSESETPTKYYSNLTVPGGTNYTENKIETPLITPSIQGHPEWVKKDGTDKGIGWFRSDDKALISKPDDELAFPDEFIDNQGYKWKNINGIWNSFDEYGVNKRDDLTTADMISIHPQKEIFNYYHISKESTKTRRILEVQSDLFQKGRDKSNLTNKEASPEDWIIEEDFGFFNVVDGKTGQPINSFNNKEKAQEFLNQYKGDNKNQFLQLLNKDNNWVTFFIKSIIQDSAKKGYEKVLFPSGDTASKVEGHTTLEEFKREKEDRIKELEKIKKENGNIVPSTALPAQIMPGGIRVLGQIDLENGGVKNTNIDNEINQLKQELERVETEGFSALKPIYNFYENTVTNILKKNYNINQITDEYGNTWNEIIIEPARDTSNILLKSSSEQFYSEQSILTQLQEDLSDAFEDYKNTLLLPEGFSKKYPIISKFINNLFNFLKKNYLIGRSYITNKKSIDQLFYEVENNILGRDFLGRRKKSIRDVFEKALDSLSKPDFKVSNWDTKTTYNFADFIVKDLFSNYLEDKYTVRSLSEVLAKYNKTTTTSIFNDFKSNLKTIVENYKKEVINRKKLVPDTDAYITFTKIMDDIFEQAAGQNKNKQFEFILDKKLEQRAYAGSTLAALEKEDEVDNLSESEKELKDEEEDSTRESWQVKLGKIDAKTKSSVRLREFFASLPKAARIVKDGKSSRSTITSTSTYNTLYYDGQYIHNKLLVELSDNSNYEDFITAINNLVPKYQFAGDIIAKILNLTEDQLMDAYDTNTLALPADIFTNTEKHDDYNMWLLKDMYQAIGDQTNQNPIKTLSKLRGKKVISSQVVKSIKETDLKNAKRTLIDTIEEKIKNDTKKQELIDKINILVDKIENTKPVSGSIKDVFSALGYGATEELLLHLQPSVSEDGKYTNLSILQQGLQSILDFLNSPKTSIDTNNRGIELLSNLISTYSTVSSGLSYINVENENEFSHRNSSYLSRINATWLKGNTKLKEWIKDMTTYTEVVNGEEVTYNVLGQFRNPAYQDLVNEKYQYRFFEDGFIQVDGQSNNGKVYSDYSPDEVLSSSINLFLGKNNEAKEGSTIKKKIGTLEHALFHIGVNSDAGQRNILHAPVFNLNSISQKLTEMVYGEIERIFYVKKGQTKDYKNLKIAGEFFQHIPELNNIRFKMADGGVKTFTEVFTATNKEETSLLWKDFNKNTNLPKIISMAMINKVTGKYGEIPIVGITYDGVLQEVIKKVLANNASNFMEVLGKKDFFNEAKSPIAATNKSELEDYYYNTFYNNIVFSNMLAGDPANYKKNKKNNKTDIEWFKRFKQIISPGIRKAFSRENFSVLILKDIEIGSDLFKDQEASITDAQGLHTLKRRLEIMRADADWDLKKDEIESTAKFINEIDPDNYTEDDLRRYKAFLETSYFQILKPFAFDMMTKKLPAEAPDGSPSTLVVKVPMQLKESEAVLLPTEAYAVKGREIYVRPKSLQDIENGEYIRPELAKLLYLMETQDVDLAIFNTGTKDEQFNVVDISTADEKVVSTSKFDFKNSKWTEQQINPRKDFNAEVNDGSQVRKIMTANVDENWTFNLNDVDYKGQKGANDLLMEIERVNALENLNKIFKKIQKADGSVDVDKALNIIKEGIIEKASDIETLEGMELLSDGKTLLPIELLGKKSQQVLNSIYKKIGKFKVKGAALINKSSFGYTRENQKLEYVDDLQLVMGTDKDGNQIIKYWEAIVPVYDAVIFNYIDANGNLLLSDKETPILDDKGEKVLNSDGSIKMEKKPLIPEKLLTAFFYRIPTEDKYSMFPIRIKKFSMPAQGGNIILPREATITAGLDFDIDKLYGYYYNFTEQFPPSIQEYTINKFSKENEVPKKILKNFITFAENNTSSNKEDIQEAFPEHFTLYDSFYKMLTSPDTKQIVDSINNKKEYNQFDDHHKLDVTKSSLNTPTGRQNLKLDAYMSLAQTPAFAKSVLNPGNKKRLLALREKKAAGIRDMNYSYADPVNLSENATKNIVGKRLIGIFANANAFYNMIQGVAKIRLRYPYRVTINGTDYEFDSIGDTNENIPRNIAELLFASTEDVKDPVLEILNINEITAGLLTTLLSLTNKDGKEIMSFEDAIEILSDPSIINAVKEVQSTGKRFDDVYKGQYRQLVEISSAYNDIVSAAKVDAQIGPDFYVVESKLEKINNILTKGIKRKDYPFIGGDVLNILPSGSNNSRIKQLNVYREALDNEILTFEDLFSFLKPSIRNVVAGIRSVAKGNRLAPNLVQKYSYYAYDAAIQNYLNSIGELQKLKTEFPIKLSTYTFPVGTEILQSAFEIKKGVVKTRWVNMSASDILTQQKNAFATLFIKDPKMATELASYAFLTGTNFTMDSIVKIVPNDFYFTDNGKVIRDIINGTKIQEYLPYGEESHMPILYNHFESITNKLEVNDKGELEIDAIELLTEPYYHVKGSKDQPNKLYARTAMGFTLVYTKPKEALPNYIVEPIDVTNAPVENSDTTMEAYTITNFEALYASSGAKKSEFDKKDVKKFNNVINKLISRGSPTSSSAGYAREFTEKSLPLNVTNYTSSDVVGISAEGNRSNRIKPDLDLISKAAAANVTFITDAVATDYNIGEMEVHKHLKALGYKNNGKGVWTKDPEDLKNDKDKLPCEGDIK